MFSSFYIRTRRQKMASFVSDDVRMCLYYSCCYLRDLSPLSILPSRQTLGDQSWWQTNKGKESDVLVSKLNRKTSAEKKWQNIRKRRRTLYLFREHYNLNWFDLNENRVLLSTDTNIDLFFRYLFSLLFISFFFVCVYFTLFLSLYFLYFVHFPFQLPKQNRLWRQDAANRNNYSVKLDVIIWKRWAHGTSHCLTRNETARWGKRKKLLTSQTCLMCCRKNSTFDAMFEWVNIFFFFILL